MDRGVVYAAIVTGIIMGVFVVSVLEDYALKEDPLEKYQSEIIVATSSVDAFSSDTMISAPGLPPYSDVESPFFITGEARGAWFENETFTVMLIGKDRLPITQTKVSSLSSIENEVDFVPFVALLNFKNSRNRQPAAVLFIRGGAPTVDLQPWDYSEVPVFIGKN